MNTILEIAVYVSVYVLFNSDCITMTTHTRFLSFVANTLRFLVIACVIFQLHSVGAQEPEEPVEPLVSNQELEDLLGDVPIINESLTVTNETMEEVKGYLRSNLPSLNMTSEERFELSDELRDGTNQTANLFETAAGLPPPLNMTINETALLQNDFFNSTDPPSPLSMTKEEQDEYYEQQLPSLDEIPSVMKSNLEEGNATLAVQQNATVVVQESATQVSFRSRSRQRLVCHCY